VHKKIITASFFTLLLLSIACSRTHAANYTTPTFPTSKYPVTQLSWILTGTTSAQDIALAYRTQDTPDADQAWSDLAIISCTPGDNQLTCQSSLPDPLKAYLQLQLTYPDATTLQTFNLALNEPQADTPTADDEQIYLSDFKNLDPALTPTTLSWREEQLTTPVHDQIIFQTRATYDGASWTDWSGNAALSHIDELEASFSAAPGTITLHADTDQKYDGIGVIYTDENNLYSLVTPAAAGSSESDAFADLSFTLDRADDLHPGDTLIFTHTIGMETFTARTLISDVKASTHDVTVFAWEGAIPQANQCGDGNSFCYPPDASVRKLQTALFPAAQAGQDLTLTIKDPQTDAPITSIPQVEDIFFYRALEPSCLEYQEPEIITTATSSATLTPTCRTKALPLAAYLQKGQPLALQYRILYGFTGDVLVTDVFLHQDTPAGQAPGGNIMTNGSYRLRGGKTFQAGNSRPYFWH